MGYKEFKRLLSLCILKNILYLCFIHTVSPTKQLFAIQTTIYANWSSNNYFFSYLGLINQPIDPTRLKSACYILYICLYELTTKFIALLIANKYIYEIILHKSDANSIRISEEKQTDSFGHLHIQGKLCFVGKNYFF